MFRSFAGLAFAASLLGAAPAHAQEWNFKVSPYFWAAGLDGKFAFSDAFNPIEISADFNDIFDDLELGLASAFEARSGRLGFLADLQFVQTGSEGTIAGPIVNNAHLELETSLVSGAITWRLTDGPSGEAVTFDILGGARYNWTDTDTDVHLTNGNTVTIGGNHDFLDAFVGGRVEIPLGTNWSLTGYGDIGTGESDYTWQVYGLLNWDFAANWRASAGYRVYDYDFQDEEFVYDFNQQGVIVGLGYSF